MKPKNFQEFFNQYLFKRDEYVGELETKVKAMEHLLNTIKDSKHNLLDKNGKLYSFCQYCNGILKGEDFDTLWDYCDVSQCNVAVCIGCMGEHGITSTKGFWACDNKHTRLV